MVITDDRPTPSDESELLSRASAGDANAFCLLIEPLQARLLRQAAALAGNLNLAEDLVSETLVEAWKSFSRFNNSCRLSTWLYAVLLHRYQKSVRRARSRPIAAALLTFFEAQDAAARGERIVSGEPSPSDTAVQRELFVGVRQCIDLLPEKHSRVILLRFFEDASLAEMSMVLGCSIGTVKSRLHHALDKLRKMKMNLPEVKGDKPI